MQYCYFGGRKELVGNLDTLSRTREIFDVHTDFAVKCDDAHNKTLSMREVKTERRHV